VVTSFCAVCRKHFRFVKSKCAEDLPPAKGSALLARFMHHVDLALARLLMVFIGATLEYLQLKEIM